MSPRRWTIREVLQWTTRHLQQQEIESPRFEAELLLAHALGEERIRLFLDPDRPLTESELEAYKELVRQRLRGLSVAHIVGYREFYSVRLATPTGVFVPRPETELIVEWVLERTAADQAFTLVDLCTGSGAIALAILAERKEATARAVDGSKRAVATAQQNAESLGLAERIEVEQAEAVSWLCANTLAVDFITCNPPYIPTGDLAGLPVEVGQHEPRVALDGGADGLDLLRRLVPLFPGALGAGGTVLIEYDGNHQSAALAALLEESGFAEISIRPDLAGHERVILARLEGAS